MTSAATVDQVDEFSHEAFLYASLPEFLDEVCGFVREGIERDEAVLVATGGARLAALRSLFSGIPNVQIVDMVEVGANPARIIPVWREFLARNVAAGRAVRGLGEPIWAGRSEAELAECHQHESLLNLAFEGGPAWRLLCPYDVTALPGEVIEEARANHPRVLDTGTWSSSDRYRAERPRRALRHRPLPPPGEVPVEMAFGTGGLAAVRQLVKSICAEHGMTTDAAEDLVLCVDEIAANSLMHGGGAGVLRIWQEPSTLVCEVSDSGTIADPLIGRESPSVDRMGGRGVWLANQLCDLVQIRSGAAGTVIRLHARLG
jgi:anti-sigma regulatory factor (Ser/Thr protein kinase)